MIMHMENIVGTAVKSIDMVSICMVYHNVIYVFLTTEGATYPSLNLSESVNV